MKLIWNKEGNLEPENESDLPMFKHCTNGSNSINFCYWQDECEAIFLAHDIIVTFEPRYST